MKVLIIIGTRPEAIKMAPVIIELNKFLPRNQFKVCVTAQHRELLDEILNLFQIKPDFDLNIMKKNQDLFDISISIMKNIKKILEEFMPDLVMVHGDTTTTMIATLCSFYKKIKVAHIESGLRTNNLLAPWPEEANRQITDLLSVIHFPPTKKAKNNLIKSNLKSEVLYVTGNTVIDALLLTKDKIFSNKKFKQKLENKFQFLNLKKINRILLVTCHRRENFGIGISELCLSLRRVTEIYPNLIVVFPVHPNPNIYDYVNKHLKNIENIKLIKPVDYAAMVYLMSISYLILTDSGGIQEEAPSLNKPVIILRDETERPEVIKSGAGILVKRNNLNITKTIINILNDKSLYLKMSNVKNPYGDGRAAKKIVKILKIKNKKN